MDVLVGKAMLSRLIDALGVHIDGKWALSKRCDYSLH